MDGLVWAIVLLLTGLALVLLELFVPSGGLLGLLSAAAFLASIFVAFKYSGTGVGTAFVVGEVVGVTLIVSMAIRWWPQTALGRKIAPELPTSADVLPDNEQYQLLRKLVGKIGLSRCPMLPAGAISIEGHTLNAISEGIAIDAHQPVRVIELRNNTLIVRPLSLEEAAAADRRPMTDDLLNKPLEELGLEPFDDRTA